MIHDLNFALELHRAEALYGYTAPSTTSGKVSDNVDLIQAARSPLPICPLEVQCSMHWLAIDGIQPEIRMNVPRWRRKYSKAKDDNKKGVRGGVEATRADEPDASPDLKHEVVVFNIPFTILLFFFFNVLCIAFCALNSFVKKCMGFCDEFKWQ